MISYDEYLDWVARFLSVSKYFGDEFYVPEDDEDIDKSDPLDKVTTSPINSTTVVSQFNFSDYGFAKQVRARVR